MPKTTSDTEMIPVSHKGLVSSEKDPKAPSDKYKAEKVEGGWQVFYYFPRGQYLGTVKRPVDDGYIYTHRQAATLRAKRLNDKHKTQAADPITVWAKIEARRENCSVILRALEAGKVMHYTVHDPLYTDDRQDMRYIVVQQLCRIEKDDFDPNIKPWQSQRPAQDDFLAFLETIRAMPEVEVMIIGPMAFRVDYSWLLKESIV